VFDASLDWCGTYSHDPKPILYFSGVLGTPSQEAWLHQQTGWTARCFSFEYWTDPRVKPAFEYCVKNGIRRMLDSGGFTLQKKGHASWLEHDAYLEKFAELVHDIKQYLDFYLPLDFRSRNFAVLESCRRMRRFGLGPVPVYHGNDPFRVLEELIGDYPLIALAQPRPHGRQYRRLSRTQGARLYRFYDRCFNLAEKRGVVFHGLGEMGRSMFQYPWYSLDASSWLFHGSILHSVITIDQQGRIERTRAPELSYQECCAHNVREYLRAAKELGSRFHRIREAEPSKVDEDLAKRMASVPRNDLRLLRYRIEVLERLGGLRGRYAVQVAEEALFLLATWLRQLHWGQHGREFDREDLRKALREFQHHYLPTLPPGTINKVLANSERLARRSPRITNQRIVEKLAITDAEQAVLWPRNHRSANGGGR
jgi:hypothetical protein